MDEYILSVDDWCELAGIYKASGLIEDSQLAVSRMHDELLKGMGL